MERVKTVGHYLQNLFVTILLQNTNISQREIFFTGLPKKASQDLGGRNFGEKKFRRQLNLTELKLILNLAYFGQIR